MQERFHPKYDSLIEVKKQYSAQQEVALINAVHAALQEAFKILSGNKNVRLIVHEPNRFACPPAREYPELYTHISIDCFAGRSLVAKRNLYRAIVQNLETVGIPKDHVKISFCAKLLKKIGVSAEDKLVMM